MLTEEEEDIIEKQPVVTPPTPPEEKKGKCTRCLECIWPPLYAANMLLHMYLFAAKLKETPPFIFADGHFNPVPLAILTTACMCWPITDLVMIETFLITYFFNQ